MSARGARSAHEHYLLKHRLLRVLVEQLGCRSFAVEDDWTKGIQLDEYVRTGQGNPRSLLADAWGPWQTEEFLDVIRWIRSYNEQNPADPVRVVGLDYGAIRSFAYDAVIDYVQQTAPERLNKLESHYEVLRPTDEIDEHIEWYDRQQHKQLFIDHARAAYNLVESLPTRDGHALALRYARLILGFYEYHASAELDEENLRMADTVVHRSLANTSRKAVEQ